MRKFLESLFGTSKGQANMQDIRVSKECRLFVSVESASNIVCYAAKGLVQDDMKRGALEYHLKTRYDQIKNSFNFIPDEVVSCWRFANIDKTPIMDEKYQAFVNFLRGKKAEKSVSLREYSFRKENKLDEKTPIDESSFKNWCRIQDSRLLDNSFKGDAVRLKELMDADEYDEKAKTGIAEIMKRYLPSDQLLARLLKVIEEKDDLEKRVTVYKDVEEIIEGSNYYEITSINDIEMLFNMPVDDMRSIHILTFELLRDELENNKANKHFKFISSLKEECDLGRIKKQILEYHSMHGGLTAEEERFKMNLDEKGLKADLKEKLMLQGRYVDDDTPGGSGKYAVVGKMGTDDKIAVGPVRTETENQEDGHSSKPNFGDMLREKMSLAKTVGRPSSVPAAGPAPEKEPDVLPDTGKEIRHTLERLSRGTLLRKEIDRYKDCPEITRAQLEWVFEQPFITPDSLISNGTMIGSIMNTRFFKYLEKRIEAYNGYVNNQFSTVDVNLISIYATILSNDIKYYSGKIGNGDGKSGMEPEYEVEIQRLILENRSTLMVLEPLLQQIKEERENERLMAAVDQLHLWTETVFNLDIDDQKRHEAAEKWISLVFLWRDSRKFILDVLKEIEHFNTAGSSAFLYSELAIQMGLAQYSSAGVKFNSPERYDILKGNKLTWLDCIVCQLFVGVARMDYEYTAKEALDKVKTVRSYFEENRKKLPPWIVKDEMLKEIDIQLATEKIGVYQELARYTQDWFSGKEVPDMFMLKVKLDDISRHANEQRKQFLAANEAKTAKKKEIPAEKVENEQKNTTQEGPVSPSKSNEEETPHADRQPEREDDTVPFHSGCEIDFGLGDEFTAGEEKEIDESMLETAEISDDALAQAINMEEEDNAAVDSPKENKDDTGKDTKNSLPSPLYFVPDRDGQDFMDPTDPDWTWEKSHLYAALDEETRTKFWTDKPERYLLLCMSPDAVEAYIQSSISPDERNSWENFYRMLNNRNKSWVSESNEMRRLIWETVESIIQKITSPAKDTF